MTISDMKLDKLLEELKSEAQREGLNFFSNGQLEPIIAALERLLPVDAGTHVIVPRIALGSLVHGIEKGSDPLSAGNIKMRQHFNTVRASLVPMIKEQNK